MDGTERTDFFAQVIRVICVALPYKDSLETALNRPLIVINMNPSLF